MVEARKIIREVSPFLQQTIASLLREAYNARVQGDHERYWSSLFFIYSTVNKEIKKEADKLVAARLEKLGVKASNFIDAHTDVVDYCDEIMKKYGVPRHKKERACNEYALTIYDVLYSCLLEAINDSGFFIVYKEFLVGREA